MLPAVNAPVFDGRGSSSQHYVQQIRLWTRMPSLEPSKAGGRVSFAGGLLAAGGDHMADNAGAGRIVRISGNSIAPGAADSINQEVAHFLQCRRAGQPTDGYIAEVDLLQRKAVSAVQSCVPRASRFRLVHAQRGAVTTGKVTAAGQTAEEPGLHGGCDGRARTVRPAGWCGPSRCYGSGGRGRVLGE